MIVAKTQKEAVAWLQNSGFDASTSSFSRHVQSGKVVRGAGGYEDVALLGYANVHLVTTERARDEIGAAAAAKRLDADAELKEVQAERIRLKLAKERGEMILRCDHEAELAARAAFFVREVENSCYRLAGKVAGLVGGDDGVERDVRKLLLAETTTWLDAYSADQVFVVDVLEEDGTL